MNMKFYFKGDDDENCYPIKYWNEYIQENDIAELTLYEARRMIDVEYFFCKFYGEVGLKSDSECGEFCESYKPRNGKNGRCTHSGYCYEAGVKTITLRLNSEPAAQESDTMNDK